MATITKNTTVEVNFGTGDLNTVRVTPKGITFSTRTGEEITLSFGNYNDKSNDLKKMIEILIHAALKLDWTDRYDSEYRYMTSEDAATLEQIARWKDAYIAPPVASDDLV